MLWPMPCKSVTLSAILVAYLSSTRSAPAPAPAPAYQQSFQSPLLTAPDNPPHHGDWDPLEHMSGISPYHDAPGANLKPPEGCTSRAIAMLIRHSSIAANDDEWEEYMEPFVQRLSSHFASPDAGWPESGRLAFLRGWKSPISSDNLEALTEPGAHDAYRQGKRLRHLHPHLFPPLELGKKGREASGNGKVKTPFKVWSASSDRDVGTAKNWIRGAFPQWQRGENGEGDGKHLALITVNNKDPNWGYSLTPHKVCKKFSKEPGTQEQREWLEVFGQRPLQQLKGLAPQFDWKLEDVIALPMLCGYESVIFGVGKSHFCDIFDHGTFRDFGYWNDLRYHKMVGYGSPLAPYLGAQWLNTSTHNLLAIGKDADPHDDASFRASLDDPLPLPPNQTHTQYLFPYFTHREEPPMALVALGIWNQTAQYDLPTDRNPEDRVWHTSHVLPFLGHVALERITCSPSATAPSSSVSKTDFVRVIVNGAVQKLPACHDGPEGSCALGRFEQFARERTEEYKGVEEACEGTKT
ncbi:Multiple inositol polyphosphate phosphatase [Ceraceosorus bombacis]|uniref:Multiple inositol polyphosphate phosphatase n=1 Tax=Ceraceosorus bombacis TaxID=401625 RepID=A0A0P1BBF2_9BASI|nr:Multiple inositol polyphosphate phosphatase [Ceraceosorus bombacis]